MTGNAWCRNMHYEPKRVSKQNECLPCSANRHRRQRNPELTCPDGHGGFKFYDGPCIECDRIREAHQLVQEGASHAQCLMHKIRFEKRIAEVVSGVRSEHAAHMREGLKRPREAGHRNLKMRERRVRAWFRKEWLDWVVVWQAMEDKPLSRELTRAEKACVIVTVQDRYTVLNDRIEWFNARPHLDLSGTARSALGQWMKNRPVPTLEQAMLGINVPGYEQDHVFLRAVS